MSADLYMGVYEHHRIKELHLSSFFGIETSLMILDFILHRYNYNSREVKSGFYS